MEEENQEMSELLNLNREQDTPLSNFWKILVRTNLNNQASYSTNGLIITNKNKKLFSFNTHLAILIGINVYGLWKNNKLLFFIIK